MFLPILKIISGEAFQRPNYAERTHEQLVSDLNDLWAQFRAEKLMRWIVTAALIALWEIFKFLVLHK